MKQTEFTDHEMNISLKFLLQESFNDKETLKEQVAPQILDEYILFKKWLIQIELSSGTIRHLNKKWSIERTTI